MPFAFFYSSHFMKRILLAWLGLIIVLVPSRAAPPRAAPVVLASPDGQVRLTLTATDSLRYALSYRGHVVLGASALGLTVNGQRLGGTGTWGRIVRYTRDEQFAWRGGHSQARDHCNGARLSVREPSGRATFAVEARVFDSGLALRYVLDVPDSSSVSRDHTAFALPAGATLWFQDDVNFYEGAYHAAPLAAVPAGQLMGPPVTVELPDGHGYAALTEGGLVDFAGLALVADGRGTLRARLAGPVRRRGPVASPWRVVMVGADLNALVNNDIVASVSAPPDPALFPQGFATPWVRPGRGTWSWLARKRDVTPDNMREFARLAGQLGFEYNLIDEGWSDWQGGGEAAWAALRDVVNYSAQQKVKTWAWKAYPDLKGIPGIQTPERYEAFFARCEALGVAGVKIDFLNSERQEIIDFYQDALRAAARHHLLVDFHGANKPTGETRTWPNELTREGIRALEYTPPWAPTTTVLPFTRFLAGHADYTPLHFGDRLGEVTWAHQLATLVAFTSPFLCFGAEPQDILDQPFRDFITAVPTVWDETVVLPPSRIGELALLARRRGRTWFLAALHHGPARQVAVPLTFLGAGAYQGTLVRDDPGRAANAVRQQLPVQADTRLDLTLNTDGGFVARFDPR